MKNILKLMISLGIILSPIWAFAVTDYYITIKNNTPYTLVEPGLWVDEGRGFQTAKADINGGSSYRYEIDATHGPGGDTRVRGGIAYRIKEFNNDHFMAGIKFNIDAHSDQSPRGAEAYTNGDDNLLRVDYRFDDSRYLDVTVTVALNFFPYHFVSHDLIWNLIPANKSFNSSKSDKLPPMDLYFNPFYDLQKTAFDIIRTKSPNNKLLEDYLTIFPDLTTHFSKEKFRESIQPLITIASNNGFEYLTLD